MAINLSGQEIIQIIKAGRKSNCRSIKIGEVDITYLAVDEFISENPSQLTLSEQKMTEPSPEQTSFNVELSQFHEHMLNPAKFEAEALRNGVR